MFNNDISIDVKSNAMYRITVLRHNLEKYLKNKITYYTRQGLEFSYKSEMKFTFITSLDFMTYKQYIGQTMPLVERRTRKWHPESADCAKALGPSDILDRNPVVDISDRWSFFCLCVHTDL